MTDAEIEATLARVAGAATSKSPSYIYVPIAFNALTDLLAARKALRRYQEVSAEDLAKSFHDTYERLAPSFSYETRKESAVPWDEVPEKNRRLMVAVCSEFVRAIVEGGE